MTSSVFLTFLLYLCRHPKMWGLNIYTHCTIMYNYSATCFFLKFFEVPPPNLNGKICFNCELGQQPFLISCGVLLAFVFLFRTVRHSPGDPWPLIYMQEFLPDASLEMELQVASSASLRCPVAFPKDCIRLHSCPLCRKPTYPYLVLSAFRIFAVWLVWTCVVMFPPPI